MSIVVNPPRSVTLYRRDSATSATPLVPSLDPEGYVYNSAAFPGGNDVKAALDELFRLSAPPTPQYAFFRQPSGNGSWSRSFTVPAGVTELLVLLINGGKNGTKTAGGAGGEAWSFYVSVSPGQKIPVRMSQSTTSSGAATNASASFGRYGAYKTIVPVENRLFSSQAGAGAISGSAPGAGGGGFWVEQETIFTDPDIQDARAEEWLAVALASSPEGKPSNATGATPGKGWPCTTKTGNSPMPSVGGSGGSFGGGGGAAGSSSTNSIGRGGSPFIAVFWGDKIRPTGTEAIPAIPVTA